MSRAVTLDAALSPAAPASSRNLFERLAVWFGSVNPQRTADAESWTLGARGL